jgi:hypothetical protein
MSDTLKSLLSIPSKRIQRPLIRILGRNWPEITKKLYDVQDKYLPSDAGAGLSPSIWDDCPRGLMLTDPTRGHFVGDDFVNANTKTFTTAYQYELAGANGTLTQLAGDPNGVMLVTAPGTDNDEANVNANTGTGLVTMGATSTWWFETRVKINQITTSQGVFVGLIDDQVTMGTDFHTDATMALKVQGYLGFQIITATDIAAIWQSTHNKAAGTQAYVNTTLATASTSWVKLGMKCTTNGTVGTVRFFVNGIADSSSVLTSATAFPLDLYGVPAWATKCGSAAANILSVDWWYAAQLR